MGAFALVAKGGDIPEVQNQSIRAWITHAGNLERRKQVLARYVIAYRETLDWLYGNPDAIKAYAAWPGLPERLARQAPDFIPKTSIDPSRVAGLDGMMIDAIQVRIPIRPLSNEQMATLVQIPR